MAHADPGQLERLVRCLRPFPVFVHLDAKTDPAGFAACLESDNLTVVAPMKVNWAGFSMVDATARMVRTALAHSDVDHLVLMTGQCYPIRPPAELDGFLRSSGGNHIRYLPIGAQTPHLQRMIEWRWFFDWDRFPLGKYARRVARVGCHLALPDRAGPPGGLVPHWGSPYWALTRECATQVFDIYRSNPELVSFYRKTFSSDEQFIHTIIANSRFAEPEHLIPYRGAATGTNCALHFVYTLPPLPRHEWRVGALSDDVDIEVLRRSGKFLARKVSPAAAARIDRELLGRDPISAGSRSA
jgi:hypothetical protein